MKEPYGEGRASHTDPDACTGGRKGSHEALTGAYAGWLHAWGVRTASGMTRVDAAEGVVGNSL